MASISQYTGINRKTGKRISDKDHLIHSLHDILMTAVGSRVMRRDYGSVLPFLVDQPMTAKTMMQMRAAIVHCLAKWEPRVQPLSIFVKGSIYTGINISIEYQAKEMSQSHSTQSLSLEGMFA